MVHWKLCLPALPVLLALVLGCGEGAVVYALDDVAGTATVDDALAPLTPPVRADYEALMESFLLD